MMRQRGPELSVGVLAADVMHLADDLGRLEAAGVRALHFDVMDGHLCPQLTCGPWFVGALRTELVKDVHLIVDDPSPWIEPSITSGAGIVTIQLEIVVDPLAMLQRITEIARGHGRTPPRRGVALLPDTPISELEPVIDLIDVVTVLGIDPRHGGGFRSEACDRVGAVRARLDDRHSDALVAFDGGVTLDNFALIVASGPDLIVTGSAAFANGELEQNLATMRELGARRG